MVKCLNIGKNVGKPIYRSISNYFEPIFFSELVHPIELKQFAARSDSKWTNRLWRLSFVTLDNELHVSQFYWFRMTWVNDDRFPLTVRAERTRTSCSHNNTHLAA